MDRPLENRRVLLGVTGGVAAYKACEVLRRLQREGAEVRVVMTAAAQRFVTPLTFEALTRHEVAAELFPANRTVKIRHVSLADWAETVLVCPATLNCIGKAAAGIADDLLTTVLSAARGAVVFAPAMDHQMAVNPAFLENCGRLRARGHRIVPVETGPLASGAEGPGRLAAPERILDEVRRALLGSDRMKGRRVLVTAGPTREPLDPVRFLSNRSSGKMGLAVAEEAALRGAEVTLVTGAANLRVMDGVRVVTAVTAAEMGDAVRREWPDHDVLVMAAAVADHRPESPSPSKIKRKGEAWSLRLAPNEDIVRAAAAVKAGRVVVGFALETADGRENALRKLREKGLDLVCLNDALEPGSGFETDTNRITLIDRGGGVEEWPLLSKRAAAARIWDAVERIQRPAGAA